MGIKAREDLELLSIRRNILLLLAYDGTDFHGWQRQPALRTAQDSVEQAVRRVVRHPVIVQGSGRTDAGVHAAGQAANFETTHAMPCDNLRKAIGSKLPKDISVIHAREVPLGLWASRHAASKLYRYRVHNDTHRPVEGHRHRYVYHCWHPLDVDRMKRAAYHLVGTHDFMAFATRGAERETTVRTILRFEVYPCYNEVRFDVEGTGFLYNQVRNMVGTLIEIGRGHWPVEKIVEILASRDRTQAGPTAPAKGLCLQWVRYDLRDFVSPPPVPAEEARADDDKKNSIKSKSGNGDRPDTTANPQDGPP